MAGAGRHCPRKRIGPRSTHDGSKLALGAVYIFCLFSWLICNAANAELARVWAVDDGTKLKATDVAHPLQVGNGIFTAKPLKVSLIAARNEVIAFQVVLVGGQAPTVRTQVELAAIGPIANREISNDPDRYFIGRRIELFRQYYHPIRRRSADLTWKPQSAAQPGNLDGLVPDALIPLSALKDPAFDVPAGQIQGIWVDVFIPKHTAPGTYRGEIVITVDGGPCGLPQCRMPIELEVIPAVLPEEPSSKTMLWFSGGDSERDSLPIRYFKTPKTVSDAQLEALRERHFKLARRHRVTLFLGTEKKPSQALRRRLSGAAFSRAAGYAGPGENVKQDLVSIHTYGGELSPGEAKAWHDWLMVHGPHATSFLYVRDEPAPAQLPEIAQIAERALPIRSFVTTPYNADLPIHIFGMPTDYYRSDDADRAKEAEKAIWLYNGVRPFSGSFVIDDVAVSPRVNPWIQYKRGIPRWFYWESTYYNDFQGGRGQIDVWRRPDNFSNRDHDRLNGDGLLFWPGRDFLFPASDQKIDGPIPSIRLKNWRRGIQDVDYLVLARKAGHGALVDRILTALLPRTLDETQAGAPVSWPDDGEKWLSARKLLADALSASATGQRLPTSDRVGELRALQETTMSRFSRIAFDGTERWRLRSVLFVVVGGGVVLLALAFGMSYWAKRRRRS